MSGGHFLPKVIAAVRLRTAERRESNRYICMTERSY